MLARSGCETSAELSYWLRTHKLQCFVMTMRDEAPEAFAAGFTDEAPDARGWIPEPPNDDDGWFMALSTIPATDPSATGFGIPQNPDASAWRRCPTPGTGKSQFPPLLAFLKHPLRKYCEKNEPYAPQMLSVRAYQPVFVCTFSGCVCRQHRDGIFAGRNGSAAGPEVQPCEKTTLRKQPSEKATFISFFPAIKGRKLFPARVFARISVVLWLCPHNLADRA